MNPTFFIGLIEICDTTLRLSEGLRARGYTVTNVVVNPSNAAIPHTGHDRYIRTSHRLLYWHDILKEFLKTFYSRDIFVFNYSTSFSGIFLRSKSARTIDYMDVALLKAMGKKIIFFCNGDDLRVYSLLIEDLKENKLFSHAKYIEEDLQNIIPFPGYERIRKKRAQILEKYADHIFAKPDRAHFLKGDYHIIWPPLNLSTVEYCINQSEEPLIVHAPSHRGVKGTKYVFNAIKKLELEGHAFKFALCENMSNEKVKEMLKNSEVAIDQLLLPGHGLFGIEAMASGNAVLGSAVPGYNGFPEELPIITTTPDTIYENMKMVLEDPGLRVELAKKGRKYVEKYHDYRRVAADFLEKIGMR